MGNVYAPPGIRPISFNAARRYLAEHHRHLSPPTGWLFGVALVADDGLRILGVGCAGRPKARHLQDGLTCEITRVATAGAPNACSQIYGALRRAADALGYTRIYTYTLDHEPGTSLRAAGFVSDGFTDERRGLILEWSRPSRARAPADAAGPKQRWVWPASRRGEAGH